MPYAEYIPDKELYNRYLQSCKEYQIRQQKLRNINYVNPCLLQKNKSYHCMNYIN